LQQREKELKEQTRLLEAVNHSFLYTAGVTQSSCQHWRRSVVKHVVRVS